MATKGGYLGADWVKVDLHLHTPGVDTFKLPSGTDINDKEKIVNDYVGKLKEAGIKLGAITDYNGIREEWFELIRSKAEEEGIVILPGVELSITAGTAGKYGLHLLLIFEESVDKEGFNRFLHSIDKNPEKSLVTNRKHRDINSKYELEQLVNDIRNRYNCLVIFTHPDNDRGLLKTLSPQEAAKYISLIKPDAFEYFSDSWEEKLVSTGEIKREFLRKIAIIENSDPKSIDEIGTQLRMGKSRVTYIKLSELSFSALKLALHDPEVRVSIYQKPEMYHSRLKRVRINGTTFLKDVEILLSPELNTFIGGRGVGKSAIIESIRYCLDLPVYAEDSQKIDFINGVIGSGGEVIIEIEKFLGQRKSLYKIKRIVGKEPEVYNENNEKLNLSPFEIFEREKNPIIIGQKELYVISQDEKFLLQLIDQFIGEKVKNKQKEFKELESKLNENGKKIIDLEKELTKKDEYDQQLKSIESKIKEYENLGVAKKLERYMQILEDDEKVSYANEKISEVIQNIENILNNSKKELEEINASLRKGKSEKKNLLEKIAKEIEIMNKSIEDAQLVSELKNIYETKIKEIINDWNIEKEKSEKEIQEVKRKLGEEKLQPDRLEQLTKQRAKLETLLKEFKRHEELLNSMVKEREELKQKIKQVRHELFKIRESELDEINQKLNGKLKIKVVYEGEKKGFKKYLSNLLYGSGVHKETIESIAEVSGITLDGILLSEIISSGKEKITEKLKLTEKMAERLIKYFEDKEKLFQLESLFPEDLIEINLNVDGRYISLNKLSPGQKATALLLIMFIMEDRILILDQPEEDLDNRFIYEDVVNILRSLKGKMQIITATHNANIPVIGDSELIVVLDKYEDQCKLIDGGSIDKQSIRDQVKRIMEGGEEAFIRRAEKYGGIR